MASGGPLPGSAGVGDKRSEPATGCPCPASCGASISSRDQHPLCIACMGVSHAQESLANPESCVHCIKKPVRILKRRWRVSAAPKENPGLDSTVASATANVKPSRSWGDMVDFPLDSPLPDNLLEHYEDEEGEGEGTEDDASAEALSDEVDEEEEEEEDAILIQPSRPSSALSGSTPALRQGGGHTPPGRQLLPAVPACMKEIRKYWAGYPLRATRAWKFTVEVISAWVTPHSSNLQWHITYTRIGEPPCHRLAPPCLCLWSRSTSSPSALHSAKFPFSAPTGASSEKGEFARSQWPTSTVTSQHFVFKNKNLTDASRLRAEGTENKEKRKHPSSLSHKGEEKSAVLPSLSEAGEGTAVYQATTRGRQRPRGEPEQAAAYSRSKRSRMRSGAEHYTGPTVGACDSVACMHGLSLGSTIEKGYRLQFAIKPPVFNGVVFSTATGESAEVLETEIASLLSKAAIRMLGEEEIQQGFYSRYFVIPKKGGSLRPILDLRILNAHLRKYAFKMNTNETLFRSIRPADCQSKRGRLVYDPSSPILAWQALDPRNSPAPLRGPVAPPPTEGSTYTGAGADFSPATPAACALGLARERMNLHAVGLPLRVINTIQSARATSTQTLYDLKWRVFEKWCEEKHVVSFQCSVAEVLCFLQEMLDKGRAFSTIKDYGKVVLKANPAFVPKVINSAYSCSSVELRAFHPPPFSSQEESRLNTLCPVWALRVYVDRMKGFRKSNQLFVSWASTHRGKPVSRQRLSHWLVEAICRAYEYSGLQMPDGLRAHSTRGMATSWALFRGVSVQDICAAASWATPHTFVRFYRLDVTAPSVVHSVLSGGSP
ncbi:hypothetical protein SKAU_G00284600 [Synaphobranchus kaupii]|uniref:Tyr recombinase domain-containing protein n=1 Tax=Synaphobranchus kaupii TaxID=118154 RepID=A0A9Q1EXQ7_SYNKA|nr:hypothetical protein SKAU_G00284600 [Synaphobranchus kaupii]